MAWSASATSPQLQSTPVRFRLADRGLVRTSGSNPERRGISKAGAGVVSAWSKERGRRKGYRLKELPPCLPLDYFGGIMTKWTVKLTDDQMDCVIQSLIFLRGRHSTAVRATIRHLRQVCA